MDEIFGLQLKAIREERHLSREQLAKLMGAGNGKTVWKYEMGALDPRIATVRRFAAALQVDAAELLEEPKA